MHTGIAANLPFEQDVRNGDDVCIPVCLQTYRLSRTEEMFQHLVKPDTAVNMIVFRACGLLTGCVTLRGEFEVRQFLTEWLGVPFKVYHRSFAICMVYNSRGPLYYRSRVSRGTRVRAHIHTAADVVFASRHTRHFGRGAVSHSLVLAQCFSCVIHVPFSRFLVSYRRPYQIDQTLSRLLSARHC